MVRDADEETDLDLVALLGPGEGPDDDLPPGARSLQGWKPVPAEDLGEGLEPVRGRRWGIIGRCLWRATFLLQQILLLSKDLPDRALQCISGCMLRDKGRRPSRERDFLHLGVAEC